jgi:hypothetical protein
MKQVQQSWKRFWRGVLGTVFLLVAGAGVSLLQACGATAMPVDENVQDIGPGGCEAPAQVDPDVEHVPAEPVEQAVPDEAVYGTWMAPE